MPTILDQMKKDLEASMRSKDAKTTSVLRMLISAIRNAQISKRGSGRELSEDDILAVLNSEAKKRKESISAYIQGRRGVLAQKEQEEIEVIGKYLPARLTSKELETIIKETMEELDGAGQKDFGRIMGRVMAKAKGRADGRQVGEIVKKMLG